MRNPFPILHNYRYRGADEAIPWEVIGSHEKQAHDNHGQSLEELARRGGLLLREMYAVLNYA